MPFNRFTYAQLTAQINVLSRLSEKCVDLQVNDPQLREAATLIGSRIRTEIDRLNRHRKMNHVAKEATKYENR